MEFFNKIWEKVIKIWKDPVWSQVIAGGIVLIITTVWIEYSKYSIKQVYDYFILILTYELPIFIFLSIIGLYFITKILINLFNKNPHPIWNEQVGNYKFKDLYQILSSQNFPVGTIRMSWAGQKPPEDDLLTMFHTFSMFFNRGLNLDDNLEDGGYLYGVLAPKLVGYGLVDKIETKKMTNDEMEIKYQTSELGYKFFALLERSIHLTMKK